MAETPTRREFPHFQSIPTRWMDNDTYGHVNNVEYYSYFDTVINAWLIEEGKLDIHRGDVIGLCAESGCRFLAPAGFPDSIDAGLAVSHIGTSSVRYEIGLFRAGTDEVLASGFFVHVFVTREGRKPAEIPGGVRASLERLLRPSIP